MKEIALNKVKSTVLIALLFLPLSLVFGQEAMPIAKIDASTSRNGEVVWIDLVTKDAEAGKEFFKALLGWEFKAYGAYSLAMSGDKPVTGMIEDKALLADENVSYWVLSAAVDDVSAASKRVTTSGGKIISKEAQIEGRGKVALVEDAQGAVMALMQHPDGDPKASTPEKGEWMWAELWTSNPKEAVSFYQNVLSITTRTYGGEGVKQYFILKGDTYEYAGITESPVDEDPIWLPVLRVDDTRAIAAKTKELGGAVLMNPIQMSGNYVALIATPTGAPFLIQELNK